MFVNIRDDDANFFTKSRELKLAYGDLIGDVPITLACTPFVSKHSFIMEDLPGDRKQQFKLLEDIELNMTANDIADMNRLYPMGDNDDLIKYLSAFVDKDKIEIALHGFNHRFYPNGAEFIKNHINGYNVRDGKHYLEKTFNTKVNIFVPPSNKIDIHALSLLKDNDLKLLTSGVIDCYSLLELIQIYGIHLLKKPSSCIGFFNKKLIDDFANFNGVDYIRSQTFKLDDTYESFMKRNNEKIKRSGFISIATHYTALFKNEKYRSRFHSLIERLASQQGVKFSTIDNIKQVI